MASICSLYGAEITWNGATSGAWDSGGSWLNGTLPGAGDNAYFLTLGTFTVSASTNGSVARILLYSGVNATFDLGEASLATSVVTAIYGGSSSLVSGTISGGWWRAPKV